jgi:hypothetical protein
MLVSLILETRHNAMMVPPQAPFVLPIHED